MNLTEYVNSLSPDVVQYYAEKHLEAQIALALETKRTIDFPYIANVLTHHKMTRFISEFTSDIKTIRLIYRDYNVGIYSFNAKCFLNQDEISYELIYLVNPPPKKEIKNLLISHLSRVYKGPEYKIGDIDELKMELL